MVDTIKKNIKAVQENLFSSVGSSILTIVTTYLVLNFFRGMFGFVMTSDKDWLSVLNNMQLYMVQAYPEEDFIRVWLSVGLTFVFAGLSIGLWRSEDRSNVSVMFDRLFKGGLGLLFFTIVAPTYTSYMGNDGSVITEEVFSSSARLSIFIPTLAITVGFFVLKNLKINFSYNNSDAVFFYLFIPVVLLWVVQLPTIQLDQNRERIIPDPVMPIANTTKIPWTIIFVSFLVSYFIGMYLKDKKRVKNAMSISWFLLPLLIFSWIFKKPQIDIGEVLTGDIPIFAIFFGLGLATVLLINNPIFKKYFSLYLGILAVLTVAGLFVGIPMLAKVCLLLLSLFTVVVPAVSTSKEGKRSLIIIWFVALVTLTFLLRGGASETGIIVPGSSIFGGFSLTWLLAIFGTYVSFPLGVLLALGRNSKLPIVRIVCTGIIELVRSVPYITWLFFASVTLAVFLPAGVEFNLIIRVLMVTAFFSGAYFAENIRGGLQSIPKGQYEAADAIGMSPFQKTGLIILPQALRAVIPTLVSSAITAFKDSSLVTIIGLFDFLTIGKTVIDNQSIPVNFVGHQRENLIFVAVVYWIFTFTLSRRSMKVEKRLGLGER
ncbi:MAG: amino acid ABC transporter permease [Actinomycetota bacterium]|nr:amino acid ABC transporter permease [Actinomycetota bacterium]